MQSENIFVKLYSVYKLNKNVFGITALVDGLGNTFKRFDKYNEAEEWIINEGTSIITKTSDFTLYVNLNLFIVE